MTFEVSLLGEKTLKTRMKCWANYLTASSLSGALSGFLYTLLLFVVFSWLPYILKMIFMIVLVGLYILHDFKILNLKVPQRKWQIPASWVNGPPVRNMWVWGSILGAGIFTYLPFMTFYILYIYIGLFKDPTVGLLFGFLYGFSRAMPTILFSLRKELDVTKVRSLYKNKSGFYKSINGIASTLFLIYLVMELTMSLK
ncbi:hypothetical protein C7121_18065 [Paenibacillus glucanolyticus]|nr:MULTISPECIES: hypothetical protein [Paenibacillus]ANA83020.1 hypothetical protein A3958_24945 [Paenibacillus glucanolyticus]AVV57892.1 hypothetical protein C7121_18065 [Paenibacillus glucanolyticus]MPY18246.1 hypothetical protein [Paenibacillus glucanolyticus]OMF83364.1 hypothetical protein BK142_01615 [Paenibacillus glucanolyticus]